MTDQKENVPMADQNVRAVTSANNGTPHDPERVKESMAGLWRDPKTKDLYKILHSDAQDCSTEKRYMTKCAVYVKFPKNEGKMFFRNKNDIKNVWEKLSTEEALSYGVKQ